MLGRFTSSLTRRQMLVGTASGALCGSAWAAAFRVTTAGDDMPSVTVSRNATSIGVLIEVAGTRVIAIDAGHADTIQKSTELVTGLMKQRVDVLLATTLAMNALPSGYLDRWHISDVLALPDTIAPDVPALAGQAITIGSLSITADGLPRDLWQPGAATDSLPWYLSITFEKSQLFVASSGAALSRLPLEPAVVTGVICNDEELLRVSERQPIDLIAVPADSDFASSTDGGDAPVIIPLYRDLPVTFRLRDGAIELPTTN